MRTWKQFLENAGGLPLNKPNYSQSGRLSGGGHFDVGEAHLTLVGDSLQIDTANHSIHLRLTDEQLQQLVHEFSLK